MIAKKTIQVFLGVIILALLFCSLGFCFLAAELRKDKSTQSEDRLSARTDSSPISNDANVKPEIEKILSGKNEDIDLARVNWLIASEIPEFKNFSQQEYMGELDSMTDQVRRDMEKMQEAGYAGTDPNSPKTRCQRFCSAVIGLRFSYAAAFRKENLTPQQMAKLYADPNNIFLAGLLRTRQGTCVSMPLIYLVIGQRLNMPVHLVAIGRHYFIRWEEPGYRMNIETTSVEKIAMTDDDSVYLDEEGLARSQISGSDLRNLSNREVVGEFYYVRSSYWHGKGEAFEARSRDDLVRAHKLAPDDPAIAALFQRVVGTR